TVVVGPNGCGKTNLDRARLLLAFAARGGLVCQIVGVGGMKSVLWAGPRRKGPVRLILGAVSGELEYELIAGLPPPPPSLFSLDPMIKEESIVVRAGGRRSELLGRKNALISARNADGQRLKYPFAIEPWQTVLGELSEPKQ